MAPFRNLLKRMLQINNCVVEGHHFSESDKGEIELHVDVRPTKGEACRCPYCGRRCAVYDRSPEPRSWRDIDGLGCVLVHLHCPTVRVRCPEHGVKTAAVPWAYHDSGFTKRFDQMATVLALQINKKAASELMRVSWNTISRAVSRTRDDVDSDPRKRLEGLVNIGVDETSYKKGHNYVTVVVNQDTNKVVWCAPGHDTETLSKFFDLLTEEQRAGIKTVAGDGAKWIDACVGKYTKNAVRCVDLFHVVLWAGKALDDLRKRVYRELKAEIEKRKKEDPNFDSKAADKHAQEVKSSTYALGKDYSRLTKSQKARLEMISNTDPMLFRGYTIKENLRYALKLESAEEVERELKRFYSLAANSGLPEFIKLGEKIKSHEEHILNTVRTGFSSARVESTNNKIKLLIRKAFGFHDVQNLIDLIMLGCSDITIPLPNRGTRGLKAA